MVRCVILFVAFLIAIAVYAAESNECTKLNDPGKEKCCKKYSIAANEISPDHDNLLHEIRTKCILKASKDAASCDFDICVAKIAGYGSDDGTLNKNVVLKDLEMESKNEPEMFDKLKKNCIDGDMSKFSLPEYCDLKKYRLCLEAHRFLACQEWSDEDECKEIKSLLQRCV